MALPRAKALIVTDTDNKLLTRVNGVDLQNIPNIAGNTTAITNNTTAISNLSNNLTNNYATSSAISAAYLLKSDAQSTYQTAAQVQAAINSSSPETLQQVTSTSAPVSNPTTGTVAITKQAIFYNSQSKKLSANMVIQPPLATDATNISSFSVTIPSIPGTTFSTANVMKSTLMGSSNNATSGTVPITYITANAVSITNNAITYTILYQPNDTTSTTLIDFGFVGYSTT